MSAEAEEKWYYSGAGVTLGPISFEELRAKAANKALDPPMQVVRSTRMNEWKKAEEIEGLFGEEAPSLPVNQGKELQGDWYYVLGKDKKGPVPLRVLKEMVENASLKQPVRMVWTAGMDQWLQVSEVAALEGSLRKLKQKVQEKIEHQRKSLLQRRAAEEELKKKEEDESSAARREAAMSAMRVQEARAIAEREERLRSAAESRALAKERKENSGVKKAPADGAAGNSVGPPPIEGDTTSTKQDRMLPELGAKVSPSAASGPVSTSDSSGEDDEISRKAQQKMEKEARMKAEAEQARQGMVKSGGLRARLGRLLGKKPQNLSVMAAKAKEEESARRAEEEQRWQDELAQRNQAKEEKRRSEQQASKVDDEASRKVEEEIKEAAAAREKAEAEAKALAIAKEKAEAEEEQRLRDEAKEMEREELRTKELAVTKSKENELAAAQIEALRRAEAQRTAFATARAAQLAKMATAQKQLDQQMGVKPKAEDAANQARISAIQEARKLAMITSRSGSSTHKPDSQGKGEQAGKQPPKPAGVVTKPGMEEPHGPGKPDEPGPPGKQHRLGKGEKAPKSGMEEPHGPGKSDEPGPPGKQGSQRKGGNAEGQAPKPLGVVSKLGMEEPHGPGKSDQLGKSDEPGKSDGITGLADGSAIDQAKDPKAVWRYTLGGEKLGPVTFERLRELADNRVLSPRTDMVWKDGFGSWMTAGEVKGLFHRSALAEAKSGNKNSGRRRKSRSARSAKQAQAEKKLPPLGARKMVGIPRRVFIPLFVAFPLVWPMALQFLLRISDGSLPADLEQAAESYGFFVPLFVALVLLAARLANIGMNRIWIIGFAVPLLNLWLGYLCFACPSHYMTYRKLGRGGMVLALLYWTTVVASIAGAGYLVFTFISAAGDPEYQEQWEQLRESLPWLPEITSDE